MRNRNEKSPHLCELVRSLEMAAKSNPLPADVFAAEPAKNVPRKASARYKVVYTKEVATALKEIANSARRELIGA